MPNYQINPDQTVGRLIPTVYIGKITLENRGSGYSRSGFQENPHIDPRSGTQVEGQKIFSNETLNVSLELTIKDVIGNSSSKWFDAGSLSNGKSLKEYVTINVVRTTTAEATNAWSKYMVDPTALITPNQQLPLEWTGTSYYKLNLTEFDNGQTLTRHSQEIDSAGNSVRSISHTIHTNDSRWLPGLSGESTELPTNPAYLAYFVWSSFNMNELFQELQSAGIGSVPSRAINVVPSNVPNIIPPSSDMTISKMNSDIVFKNNKLVSTGFVFYEANVDPSSPNLLIATDNLWNGPVHYHRNELIQRPITGGTQELQYTGFMGGEQHGTFENQPFLKQVTVPNNKIQDFRVVKRIKKLKLSFTGLENKLLQIIRGGPRSVAGDAEFSFFSDILLSRDKDNNCRFFFGIDLKKMLRENSPYAGLFINKSDSANWLVEALNTSRILSMKIYRKRVEGSSELGTTPYYYPGDNRFDPFSKLKKFNNGIGRAQRTILNRSTFGGPFAKVISYDPTDELIIEANENPDRTLNFNSIDNVSSIQYSGGGNNIQGFPAGTFCYTGTDGEIGRLTDGYYQYRVELEIQDNVTNLLLDRKTRLLRLKQSLQSYFQEASSTGTKFASGDVDEANFDPTSNRFTQRFINNWSNLWPRDIAEEYVDVLSMFVNLNFNDHQEIIEMLNRYIAPSTGNLEGCLVLLKLLQDLIGFLQKAIGLQETTVKTKAVGGVNATGQTATTFESNVEKQGAPTIKTFKLEHTFSNYYDGNLPENVGFDFLGAGYNQITRTPGSSGLRIISANEYENTIVAQEITKLFNSSQSTIDMSSFQGLRIAPGTSLRNTDFSFLTPAAIHIGPNKDYLMIGDGTTYPGNISNRDFINMTANSITSINNPNLLTTNSLEEKVADFLSYNYNLSAIPNPEPTKDVYRPGERPLENFDPLVGKDWVAASNAQTRENQKAFDVFWDLVSNGVVSAGSRGGVALPEGENQISMDYWNVSLASGFYNKFLNSIPKGSGYDARFVDAINKLPNQVKALIGYNSGQSSINRGINVGAGSLKVEIDNFLNSEPFKAAPLRPKARILFETIGEIQILTGFGETEYGTEKGDLQRSEDLETGATWNTGQIEKLRNLKIKEFSLGLPNWETLNRTNYERYRGKQLICRIRPWENEIFKIKRTTGSDLPTYEEYFLMGSVGTQAASQIRSDTPLSGKTLEHKMGPEQDQPTNIRIDYITSNWNFANELTTPGPPTSPTVGGGSPGASY